MSCGVALSSLEGALVAPRLEVQLFAEREREKEREREREREREVDRVEM